MGVWIETLYFADNPTVAERHTLRGCVDWNTCAVNMCLWDKSSHPSWVCGLKPSGNAEDEYDFSVTPFVGVWIETWDSAQTSLLYWVTPFVGVWIETWSQGTTRWSVPESHPSWVCGLKQCNQRHQRWEACVTPFVGVWIETLTSFRSFEPNKVTPFVGVWIETES